jgi:hypothetical protein
MAPRYDQMARNVNKEMRVRFAKACIANDDNVNDVSFTDECSVQLNDNKMVFCKSCFNMIYVRFRNCLKGG